MSVTDDADRGVMDFDSPAGLVLRSEIVGGLTYGADAVTEGMQVRFRVPGGIDIRDLYFRAEPD